jgi:outer membrane protein TolC
VDKARKDNGLNASLDAAFGLSNRGAQFNDVYVRPQDREFVELKFTLPLMTWGRAQARTETAKANQQLTCSRWSRTSLPLNRKCTRR